MFQLIVSVIAIALVAILAAASIYYGGSAFNSSTTKGAVAALINAGEQIAGAEALYTVDNTVLDSSISDLESGTYLSGAPVAPHFASGAWGLTSDGGASFIGLSTASAAQVCTEVGIQGGTSAGTIAVSGSTTGSVGMTTQFGCDLGQVNFVYKN
jgi:hypothetical protein